MNHPAPDTSELAVSQRLETDRSPLEILVANAVHATGLWCEKVDVTGSPGSRVLQVTVDREDGTEGVSLDEVSAVSQAISDTLDRAGDPLPQLGSDAYHLEVGSPGISRPLTTEHHYRRNVGRLVTVTVLAEQPETPARTITARILSVDEDGVSLSEYVPGAKKGMRPKEKPPVHHSYSGLSPAVVQVELSNGAG